MTARDAFGNPIDDDGPTTGATKLPPAPDPLGERAPEPAAATVAQPPPPTAWVPFPNGAPPTYQAPPRAEFDLFDKLTGLFFVALFVVPLAIGGWVAWSAFHDAHTATSSAIKSIQRPLTPTTPAQGDDPAKPPATPTGLGARSLLRPAALGKVLAAARRDPGGRLGLLRLAPERADLQLARRGGGLDLLQLRWDGGRSLVRSPGTAPAGALAFSAIDRGAPRRLVRAAARRIHKPTAAIDYVVLINVGGGPRWSAYFKGGAAFLGDAHGHITQRIQ